MGYSFSTFAGFAQESIIKQLQGQGEEQSNVWKAKGKRFFFEQGREQLDGSITGQVMRFVGENSCVVTGGAKISRDGIIQRWPSTTKKQRDKASIDAYHKMAQRFGRKNANRQVENDHPAYDLAHGSFSIQP